MTREQAKKLLPIFQAFAEGKQIQVADGYGWFDLGTDPRFRGDQTYRIKPENRSMKLYINFDTKSVSWIQMPGSQEYIIAEKG